LIASPHISNNASKMMNEKKEINMSNGVNKMNNNKGKLRYRKDSVHDEQFILKQVKSCQSEESDGVINDYY
jgi:hypothetical protein